MELPVEFLEELKEIIGEDDLSRYVSMFCGQPYRGISVNRLKTSPEKLLPLLGIETQRSPFYADGFYLPPDYQNIGKHPLHHAGAFYVQEPSAMSAVSLLDVKKGDRVLDMCAAPGGKSAQIASLLGGTGLIWSNEIVKSRAQILLSNFERMGISQGVVSSCHPDILSKKLEGCFDKVLVDAPCSGEGMFRKDNAAVLEWSREHVSACAERQLAVLMSAVKCLRDGGTLVYSTCTFSYEENENNVKRLLELCPELSPYPAEEFGRRTELSCAVRITPLEGGEGHFAARFRKNGDAPANIPSAGIKKLSGDIAKQANAFLEDIFVTVPDGELKITGDKLYILPRDLPAAEGTGIIRAGVQAGELIKNRIEPCHALFTSYPAEMFRRVEKLGLDDRRTVEFLHGMEIDCTCEKGYAAAAVEGMTVGFGKCSGGRLKNKYPKGLRI